MSSPSASMRGHRATTNESTFQEDMAAFSPSPPSALREGTLSSQSLQPRDTQPWSNNDSTTSGSATKRSYDSFLGLASDGVHQPRSEMSPLAHLEGSKRESASASSIRIDEHVRYSFRKILSPKYISQRFAPMTSPLSLSASPTKAFTSPTGTKRLSNDRDRNKANGVVSFKSTIDQVPYRGWKDETTGQVVKTWGALIPKTYRKSDDPGFPWICPIRSCRMMFESLAGLGNHFMKAHRATKLNDNLDGTLTDLGTYASKGNGNGGRADGVPKPGVVVSKQRLSTQLYPLKSPSHLQKHNVPKSGPQFSPKPGLSVSKEGPPFLPVMEFASPERRYDMWPDESRRLRRMQGSLIPEGYQQDQSLPGRPWVCPIRSCRCLFSTLSELEKHFRKRHRGCQLNDNLDGTFSAVSITENHENPSSSKSWRQPAIVVSQRPFDTTTALSDHEDTPDVWKYLCSRLAEQRIGPEVMTGSAVDYLLKLPRLRPLAFNQPLTAKMDLQKITALLIHLTGQESRKPCTHCRNGTDLLGPCVQFSQSNSDTGLRLLGNRWRACASCLFRGEIYACSIGKPLVGQKNGKKLKLSTTALETQPHVAPIPNNASNSVRSALLQGQTEHVRRSPRNFSTTPRTLGSKEEKAPRGSIGGSSHRTRPRQTNAFLSTPPTPTRPPRTSARRGPNARARPRSNLNPPAASQPEVIVDPEELVVEPWEQQIGPGQITSSRGTNSMALAYSGSQLSTTSNHQFIQATADISVTAVRINSGTPHHFPADETSTRICTLANGKLRVKVGDEDEYAIGAKGVFKIDAGLGCRVFNRCYEDVVLHVNGFRSL